MKRLNFKCANTPRKHYTVDCAQGIPRENSIAKENYVNIYVSVRLIVETLPLWHSGRDKTYKRNIPKLIYVRNAFPSTVVLGMQTTWGSPWVREVVQLSASLDRYLLIFILLMKVYKLRMKLNVSAVMIFPIQLGRFTVSFSFYTLTQKVITVTAHNFCKMPISLKIPKSFPTKEKRAVNCRVQTKE